MDPRQIHSLAVRLAAGKTAEEHRTAINRAYYAAYNVGVELLVYRKLSLPMDAEAHRRVREFLANSGDQAINALSGKLRDLYVQREIADYRLHDLTVETPSAALKAVRLAGDVITALDQLSMNADRAQAVRQSMGRWDQRQRS